MYLQEKMYSSLISLLQLDCLVSRDVLFDSLKLWKQLNSAASHVFIAKSVIWDGCHPKTMCYVVDLLVIDNESKVKLLLFVWGKNITCENRELFSFSLLGCSLHRYAEVFKFLMACILIAL